MASVVLLAALVLCVSFPARAQDIRPHQEYVDKGYCTYTYVVPPGSRTGSFSPPRLEEQLAETKEETAYLKNQVDLLTSMVQTLLGLQSDLTNRVDSLGAELDLEQNLTQELQEQEIRLQTQVQDLSDELSEEKARNAQLQQNLSQELLAKEAKFLFMVENLSAQISEEANKNRGLALNLTQVELKLNILTTTVHEHRAIITQGVKCTCHVERPVPGDVISTTAAPLPREPVSAVVSLTRMTSRTEPMSITPRAKSTEAAEITPGAGTATGIQVRLAGGSTPLEGRVEVRNGTGQWGSVCDDDFDLQDAHVVCRQLGFGAALEVKLAGHFGEGSGNVWLDEVACRGDETDLGDCPGDSWGRSDCSHKEDVGVVCAVHQEKSSVRLTGGHVPWEGRLEARPGEKSEWGAVCNTSWTEAEARFVCRQMGYTGGVTSSGQADIGEGSENIWLGDVTCSGDETNFLSCGFSWEPSDCHHGQDVVVFCTGAVFVRLVGGQNASEGRVEVRPGSGDWGTVCDDGFDDRDAQVVCSQLGYRDGVARVGGVFPEGAGNIWLDNLNCAGNESSVADCEINRWGEHDCTHKEDAGVVCTDAAEKDCAEYHSSGVTTSGVYRIGLRLPDDVEAYCDMDTAGGGWTVIQRRQDGSVPFNRNWEEYKLGFGNKNGEYWLGNENIHLLTNQKNYSLRVDMTDWNNESRYALYSTFRVSGESDGYRLHISGYSGTAIDSMAGSYNNNGYRFSTVDRDNDAYWDHCSQRFGQAGWWFGACSHSLLNGRYLGNCGNSCPGSQGVMWWHWKGPYYSLKSVSMKIRPLTT